MTPPSAHSPSRQPRQSTRIEALFPHTLFGTESLSAFEATDAVFDGAGFDVEAVLIEAASPLRRQHFLAGRACAHAALEALDVGHSGIGRHESRAPLWPAGVIGAITHTTGFAAAVVALDQQSTFGIGLDAEQIGRVDNGVANRVMNDFETRAVAEQPNPHVAATALFCAKESFYKAQWPHTRSWVGFEDVTVSFNGPGMLELQRATERSALDGFSWPIAAGYFFTEDPARENPARENPVRGIVVAGLVASRLR